MRRTARLLVLCLLTALAAPVTVPAAENAVARAHGFDRPFVPGGIHLGPTDDARGKAATDLTTQALRGRVVARMGERAFQPGVAAMESARIAAAERFGVDLPQPAGTEELRQARARTAGARYIYSDRAVWPAGDSTGDGLVDVLDLSYREIYNSNTGEFAVTENLLTARRGVDGQVLWSVDLLSHDGAFAFPNGDMTGDGIIDVLVLAIDLTSEQDGIQCEIVACVGSASATFTWTFGVLSGVDGSSVWSKTLDGNETVTVAEAGGLVASAAAFKIVGTNAFVLFAPAGLVASPGQMDLIVNAYDIDATVAYAFAGALVGFAGGIVFDALVGSRATVIAGESGQTITSKVDPLDRSEGYLGSAGDAVGNAASDQTWNLFTYTPVVVGCAVVLVVGTCEFAYLSTQSMDVIDGSSGVTVWTHQFSQVDFQSLRFLSDLSGDGKGDAILRTERADGTGATSLLNGATGATIWSRPELAYPIIIGSVGGSPGRDLALVRGTYDDVGVTVDIARVDGPTGTTLLATQRSGPVYDAYVFPVGDGDGDGAIDLAIEFDDFFTASVAVESMKTGATLLSKDDLWFSQPAGDLDGDGRADLTIAFYEGGGLGRSAHSLFSGSTLWNRTGDAGDFGVAVPIGDTEGAVGDELAVVRFGYVQNGEDEMYGARVDLLRGPTGQVLFGFGDALTSGGSGNEQWTLRGTVTNIDGPLAGVRVRAVATSGWVIDEVVTAADGTWTIPGEFSVNVKLAFNDPTGLHRSEWHLNRSSFESADIVQVAGGSTVTLDAELAVEPPPANDNRANAETIEELPFGTVVNLGRATAQDGEECVGGRTAWYRYIPSTPLPIFAGVQHFSDESQVASIGLYRGNDPDALTFVDCGYEVTTLPVAGETYWIQVGLSEGWPDVAFYVDNLPN